MQRPPHSAPGVAHTIAGLLNNLVRLAFRNLESRKLVHGNEVGARPARQGTSPVTCRPRTRYTSKAPFARWLTTRVNGSTIYHMLEAPTTHQTPLQTANNTAPAI